MTEKKEKEMVFDQKEIRKLYVFRRLALKM